MENEEVDKVQTRSSRIKTTDVKNFKEISKQTCQNTCKVNNSEAQLKQNKKIEESVSQDTKEIETVEIENHNEPMEDQFIQETKINKNMSENNKTIFNIISENNIEKTIPVFEGDSGMIIDMWIKNFEEYSEAYG